MDTTTEDGISANSQNTSVKVDEDKKKMDTDGPSVSKKKRKNRNRKKKQLHSRRSNDDKNSGALKTEVEMPEVVLANSCSKTQPEPKPQTRGGSKKRFSGLFKRKSRSESRSRSTSETNLYKIDKKSTSKRHQSAEDIKRGTMTPYKNAESYLVYDVTKQPRNRLQRMTVRDAIRERQLYAMGSRQRLSLLEKQIDTEESVKGSSLPDVSFVGIDADTQIKTHIGPPSVDNVNIRGSASLPRQKIKRKNAKQSESGKDKCDINLAIQDPISIEADPSETLPEHLRPVSILKHSKPNEPPVSSISTSHSVLVHETDKGSDDVMHSDVNKPLNVQSLPSSKSPFPDRLHPEQSKTNASLSASQSKTRSHSPVISTKHSRSKAASRWKIAIEDVKAKRRKESLSKFLLLSRSPPSSYSASSMARNKVRGLSPFCLLNISRAALANKRLLENKAPLTNQSSVGNTFANQMARDLSPWKKLRQVVDSPTGIVLNSKLTEVKPMKPLPEITIAGTSQPTKEVMSSRDNVSSSVTPDTTVSTNNTTVDNTQDKRLTVSHLGGFVGKGIGRQFSGKSYIKTNSLSKEPQTSIKEPPSPIKMTPTPSKEQLGNNQHVGAGSTLEQKNVPIMGTSVQQIYKRTFSPKRQQSVENKDPGLQIAVSSSEADKDAAQSACDKENVSPDIQSLSPESLSLARQTLSPDRLTPSPDRHTLSPDRLTLLPDGLILLPDGLTLSPDRLTLSPDRLTLSPDRTSESDSVELGRALDSRGRDSQRRRYSGRSFRRKKEKEEDEAAIKEKEREETTKLLLARLAVEKCDKSTQTSDTEKTPKLLSKFKKHKKNKKVKEIAITVHQYPVKEETMVGNVSKESLHVEEPPADDKISDVKPEVQDEPKTEETKVEVEGEHKDSPKPKPKKLSFTSIVFLKAKLAKRKKKAEADEKSKKVGDADIPYDIFTIENEINLQKLAEIKETDILDDEIVEPEMGIEIPRKKLRFEPMPSDEPVQSEEPLPPFRPRASSRRNSTMREKRKKCLHCCKRFTAFLFSHIGLCSLVVAYTIMGGFVFKAIEGPFEERTKILIMSEREDIATKVLQQAVALQMSDIGRENFTKLVGKELLAFQAIIYRETKDHGWDGKDAQSGVPEQQWSFASSLLYAITVMTTIGYGHVAPKTDQGRIVTIAYAVLGIPLTLLCLTNIGDVMATGFRLLYGKICCGVCCKLFGPSRRRRVPDVEKGLGGQVLTSEEEEADKPKEVIRVPTSLCLLLIAAYIFGGAMLFSLWEQWDYLTGSYFCFITLSTIGFGDIVPGTDLNAWAQEEKLVLCALYLVFGLSLIAMCFNLVQEDVKAKCRWLGTKIGIIDKPQSSV